MSKTLLVRGLQLVGRQSECQTWCLPVSGDHCVQAECRFQEEEHGVHLCHSALDENGFDLFYLHLGRVISKWPYYVSVGDIS